MADKQLHDLLKQAEQCRKNQDYAQAVNVYQQVFALKQTETTSLKQQLAERQTKLEETKKLVYLGTMATAVAHEINQPVGIIRAATNAVLLDVKEKLFQSEEELEPFLQRILAQTERLHGIIENFRIFARGDRTRREEVNLNHVVEQMVALFLEQLKHRNITLELRLCEDQTPPIVSANLFQLEEVLINLLTNARDTVEGQEDATVWINTWRNVEKLCGFSIEDNGAGLTAEYREHLFMPFMSTKPTEQGTGLGLYISRKIIHDFDGKLCYEDRPGGGARFVVTLPSPKDKNNGPSI